MAIQEWSDSITVVDLVDDPQFTEELAALAEAVETKPTDVVLNFSAVGFINSSNLSRLLRAAQAGQHAHERRLVLCGVNAHVGRRVPGDRAGQDLQVHQRHGHRPGRPATGRAVGPGGGSGGLAPSRVSIGGRACLSCTSHAWYTDGFVYPWERTVGHPPTAGMARRWRFLSSARGHRREPVPGRALGRVRDRRPRDRHPGGQGAQPPEHRRPHPPRQAGGHHRPERLGQELAGLRHDLRRGAAQVRREPLGLRPPVPGAAVQARRGAHRGPAAHGRHRAARRRRTTRGPPSPPPRRSTTTCGCCSPAWASRTAGSAASRSPRQTVSQMVDAIFTLPEGTRFMVLSPIIRGQKGQHAETAAARCSARGSSASASTGRSTTSRPSRELDKNRKHTIEVVVDRLVLKDTVRIRLTDSIETALKLSGGLVIITYEPQAAAAGAARPAENAGQLRAPGRTGSSAPPTPARATPRPTCRNCRRGCSASTRPTGPATAATGWARSWSSTRT